MGFHLGKPILVMCVLGALAGVIGFSIIDDSRRADIEMWTFTESHWRTFTGSGAPATRPLPKRDFERETGKSVSIKLVNARALNTRLSMQFMGDIKGDEVPDLVEVEISNVGRFFRPPVSEVGFLPLNDFIKSHGWEGKIVESRFAPWSKQGVIFGIPHDVHPVMIAYNAELFEQAGVDLASSQTWQQFWDNCIAFQTYWRERGVTRRWAMEMSESSSDTLVTMLLQRGVNVVDDQDTVRFNDPKVLDTLLQYVRMIDDGPQRIGASTASGNQAYSQDLASGFVGAMFCADWRLKYVKDYAPTMAGKLKVMSLPAWPDSPFRTSTWGGTMIGIPHNARDPELSWQFLERLYLRPDGLRNIMQGSYILPPVKTVWNDAIMEEQDAFYSGQHVRRLIRELAGNVPPRYVTPASTIAQAELSMVLIDAIARHRSHGEEGLEVYCKQLLDRAQHAVAARIAHGNFEGEGERDVER
jgi:arabinosaccharide transport system substrate-binding protein